MKDKPEKAKEPAERIGDEGSQLMRSSDVELAAMVQAGRCGSVVPRINPKRLIRGYLIPGEPLYVRE